MPDIRNCPRCGKIFSYLRSPICPNCQQEEEAEFQIVKQYIYDYPGVNMAVVAQETGVSIEKIMRFLREERLELTSDSDNLILECERCHVPIKSGRFCDSCKNDLDKGFKKEFGIGQKKEPAPLPKKATEEKMYTITRIRGGK